MSSVKPRKKKATTRNLSVGFRVSGARLLLGPELGRGGSEKLVWFGSRGLGVVRLVVLLSATLPMLV